VIPAGQVPATVVPAERDLDLMKGLNVAGYDQAALALLTGVAAYFEETVLREKFGDVAREDVEAMLKAGVEDVESQLAGPDLKISVGRSTTRGSRALSQTMLQVVESYAVKQMKRRLVRDVQTLRVRALSHVSPVIADRDPVPKATSPVRKPETGAVEKKEATKKASVGVPAKPTSVPKASAKAAKRRRQNARRRQKAQVKAVPESTGLSQDFQGCKRVVPDSSCSSTAGKTASITQA